MVIFHCHIWLPYRMSTQGWPEFWDRLPHFLLESNLIEKKTTKQGSLRSLISRKTMSYEVFLEKNMIDTVNSGELEEIPPVGNYW